jgi:predicted ATP-dependent endonuclease of OLD family
MERIDGLRSRSGSQYWEWTHKGMAKELHIERPAPLIARTSPDQYSQPPAQALGCCVKQLRITNFKCVTEARIGPIPVDSPWIIIVGDNAVGKTSILQALAIGLYGSKDADRLLEDSPQCRIGVEAREIGASIIVDFRREGGHWKDTKRLSWLAAYGPCRIGIRPAASPVYSLHNQAGNLNNIEDWLFEQTLKTINPKESGQERIKDRIEKVKRALARLMPRVSGIKIEGDKIYYRENGIDAPLDYLASGNKSTLAMIGDLMTRLFETQPDIYDPHDLQGIVIIDELEIHLHPNWQREFPRLLTETFPKIQFIASARGIVPCLYAPKNSTFIRVTRTPGEGAKMEQIDTQAEEGANNA